MPQMKTDKTDPEEYDAWFRRKVEDALKEKRDGAAKYRPLEEVAEDHGA